MRLKVVQASILAVVALLGQAQSARAEGWKISSRPIYVSPGTFEIRIEGTNNTGRVVRDAACVVTAKGVGWSILPKNYAVFGDVAPGRTVRYTFTAFKPGGGDFPGGTVEFKEGFPQ